MGIKVSFPHTQHPEMMEFVCLGCESYHWVRVVRTGTSKVHTWNGDLETPSLVEIVQKSKNSVGRYCEFHMRAGYLIYTSSCTHRFAGRTVAMPDYS